MLSKNDALAWENLGDAILTFLPVYIPLANACLSRFKWDIDNAEKLLDSAFIEKLLFYKGRAAIVNDKSRGLIVCDFTPIKQGANFFGYPSEIQALDVFDYNNVIGNYNYDDFVIIENNPLWYPTNITLWKYALDIANIFDAVNLNVDAQKFPIVFQGDSKQKLTMEQLADKIECGDRYIFMDKDYKLDDITTLEINAKFVAKELYDVAERVSNTLLTAVGINNANSIKQSGITTEETNANNELITINYNVLKLSREKAVNEVKEKFNKTISVSENDAIIQPFKLVNDNNVNDEGVNE